MGLFASDGAGAVSITYNVVKAFVGHPFIELVVLGVEITHDDELVALLKEGIDQDRKIITKQFSWAGYICGERMWVLGHVD